MGCINSTESPKRGPTKKKKSNLHKVNGNIGGKKHTATGRGFSHIATSKREKDSSTHSSSDSGGGLLVSSSPPQQLTVTAPPLEAIMVNEQDVSTPLNSVSLSATAASSSSLLSKSPVGLVSILLPEDGDDAAENSTTAQTSDQSRGRKKRRTKHTYHTTADDTSSGHFQRRTSNISNFSASSKASAGSSGRRGSRGSSGGGAARFNSSISSGTANSFKLKGNSSSSSSSTHHPVSPPVFLVPENGTSAMLMPGGAGLMVAASTDCTPLNPVLGAPPLQILRPVPARVPRNRRTGSAAPPSNPFLAERVRLANEAEELR